MPAEPAAFRAPMPRAVAATAALVLGVAATAAASRAWTFAVWLLLMGLLPWRRSARLLRWGSALAYGSFGWEALGLAPVASGMRLEGPWGGPPLVFALALLANVLRLAALRAERTRRWAEDSSP